MFEIIIGALAALAFGVSCAISKYVARPKTPKIRPRCDIGLFSPEPFKK